MKKENKIKKLETKLQELEKEMKNWKTLMNFIPNKEMTEGLENLKREKMRIQVKIFEYKL